MLRIWTASPHHNHVGRRSPNRTWSGLVPIGTFPCLLNRHFPFATKTGTSAWNELRCKYGLSGWKWEPRISFKMTNFMWEKGCYAHYCSRPASGSLINSVIGRAPDIRPELTGIRQNHRARPSNLHTTFGSLCQWTGKEVNLWIPQTNWVI